MATESIVQLRIKELEPMPANEVGQTCAHHIFNAYDHASRFPRAENYITAPEDVRKEIEMLHSYPEHLAGRVDPVLSRADIFPDHEDYRARINLLNLLLIAELSLEEPDLQSCKVVARRYHDAVEEILREMFVRLGGTPWEYPCLYHHRRQKCPTI